ncbi:uncharacterized protein BJX67DRAFT_339904 [Aspergillus lucknowensis]|uniref:Uncharacterized protein n=1 Tax=Aspergillus lucknowensis TaxID=176173 RepID=A0ABR4M7L1_9EURO
MIEYIACLGFRLLETQDPRLWPTVVHLLLLLSTIEMLFSFRPEWVAALVDTPNPFWPFFGDPARYFYVSAGGRQI